MGLLSFLLGKKDKKSVAKELLKDIDTRQSLWKKHLENHSERSSLSRWFDFGNIKDSVENAERTKKILAKIESLTISDFINIENEEKLDKKTIKDLEIINSYDFEALSNKLVNEKNKEITIHNVFTALHDLLITELHLIKMLKNTADSDLKNKWNLLTSLFQMISLKEYELYKSLDPKWHLSQTKSAYDPITPLLDLFLAGKKLKSPKAPKPAVATPEEKLAGKIAENMQEDKENEYRELAEDILEELVEKTGGEVERGDDEELFARMEKIEKIIDNDKQMLSIIKKLKTKYDEKTLKIIVGAFRKAHESGNFNIEELLIG